jgi:molecular chaperone Hsp31 and glyoxalase 3
MAQTTQDRNPSPDLAEDNAFFPSPYSLSQYTASKTDFDGTDYPTPYIGHKKVLMVASDERYLLMKNGKFFSTGNHPVETLLPMYHLDRAGFDIDIATLSGNPVKLEMWAMPHEDAVVPATFQKYLAQFKKPLKLADVLKNSLGDDSPYLAVLIPGGHGALIGLPDSEDLKTLLKWAVAKDKFVISLCHGPAGLLAAAVNETPENYIFKGYKMCVFPDALDQGANLDIGYMPGELPWLLADRLEKLGVEVVNKEMSGQCIQDRKLITGDSPLASNTLGKMAAQALLAEVQ